MNLKPLTISFGMLGMLISCTSDMPKRAEAPIPPAQQFRGDVTHSGVYQTKEVQGAPEVLWKFKTEARIVSSPVLGDRAVFVGSYDGFLYAIDRITGQQRWKFECGGQVKSSPAVYQSTVYFSSKDGVFHALDEATGQEKWSFSTRDAETHAYELGIPWFPAGIDDSLYANMAETRFAQINDPWDGYYSSPLIVEGLVYFGGFDGCVYALDANSGRQVWSKQTDGAVRSTPAYWEGKVYVGSFDGNMYALDARTGAEKWRRAFTPNDGACPQIQSSPAIADGIVYYGGRDNYMHALDAETGATIWESFQKAWGQEWGSWLVASAAVHRGVAYIGTSDGLSVLALDAKTGQEKWTFKTERNVFGSASIAGNTLYVADFDAYAVCSPSFLYALDVTTGQEKWRFATLGSQSSPVIDNGILYFGTEDGYLVALK